MKNLKRSIILTAVLVLMFSLSVGITNATNYTIAVGGDIDAYGYGADFFGYTTASEDADGFYSDVTGVKVRTKVYEDGVLVEDTAKTDTSAPYNVRLEASVSSDDYSNYWDLYTTHYYKQGSSTSYTALPMGLHIEDSNE